MSFEEMFDAYRKCRNPVYKKKVAVMYNALPDNVRNTWLAFFEEGDRRLIELSFGRGDTLASIGREFGVTQERIRQRLARIWRKTAHPIRRHAILWQESLNYAKRIPQSKEHLEYLEQVMEESGKKY